MDYIYRATVRDDNTVCIETDGDAESMLKSALAIISCNYVQIYRNFGKKVAIDFMGAFLELLPAFCNESVIQAAETSYNILQDDGNIISFPEKFIELLRTIDGKSE